MKSASFAAACAAALVAISVAPSASAQEAQPPPQDATPSSASTTTTTTTTTTTAEPTAAPPPATAEAPTFGKAGEVVLTYTHFWGWGGTDAGMRENTHIYNGAFVDVHNTTRGNGGGKTFQFTVQPSADYFVIDNLSVGAFVGFAYTKSSGGMGSPAGVDNLKATAWQFGPRVGYNIPLGSLFSIWPKVGYSFQTLKVYDVPGLDKAINTSEIDVSIPIMFHPAPHFFLGFGPALAAQINNNFFTDTTDPVTGNVTHHRPFSIGGQVTVGGWLGPL
ncbi:MAG: porin family protein [Polyangiaceae bacterium]|nr:porin family protein [Polyangiaceae bacterium]